MWHNEEWHFFVVDIAIALTDTINVTDYIKKMRKRDEELAKGWGQIVTPIEIETRGGKQKINCANTEGIFRIIQSRGFHFTTGTAFLAPHASHLMNASRSSFISFVSGFLHSGQRTKVST